MSPLCRTTVTTAIAALLPHLEARKADCKPQLLDDDDFVILLLSLHRIPSNPRLKPFFLPLPHPLYSPSSTSAFLIAPTDDSAASALTLARNHPFLSSILSDSISVSSLRTDYRPYESRRKLCGSHDFFFADRSIVHLLPRLIGKEFFLKKKIPIPIDLSRPGWPEQIRRCIDSALFYLRSGTCSGIKVGRIPMGVEKITDNILSVIESAVEKVPKKWAGVSGLYVKSVDSISLPVYQAVPETGLQVALPGSIKAKKRKRSEPAVKAVNENGLEKAKKMKRKKGSISGFAMVEVHERKSTDKSLAPKEKKKRTMTKESVESEIKPEASVDLKMKRKKSKEKKLSKKVKMSGQ